MLAMAGTPLVILMAGVVPIVQTLMRFGLGSAEAGVLLTTAREPALPADEGPRTIAPRACAPARGCQPLGWPWSQRSGMVSVMTANPQEEVPPVVARDFTRLTSMASCAG